MIIKEINSIEENIVSEVNHSSERSSSQQISNTGGIFSSLKERNFLLYILGQCISLSGSWIQTVALSWLVYRLSGSIILLTTVALLTQLPYLVITPFSGVLSDRFDRMKILITTQSLFMLQAFVFAWLTLSGRIEIWHIMVLSLFIGIVAAIDVPSRQSFYSTIVPKEAMTNAIAINSATINGARFVGPMIGGVMISSIGEGYCFFVNGVSYIAVLTALFMIKTKPYVRPETDQTIVKSLKEGLSYVYDYVPLRAILIFVASISFFVLPFMNILPALVKDVLIGDSKLLGYMSASIGIGAFSSALTLAARKNIKGLGRLLSFSGIMMGVSLILISLTKNQILACILCCPIGFTMIGAMAASNTLLQTIVEDGKRGRVMSLFAMCFMGMAPLGGMLYGWFAEISSLGMTILFSGFICILVSLIFEFYRPVLRSAIDSRSLSSDENRGISSHIVDSNNNPF